MKLKDKIRHWLVVAGLMYEPAVVVDVIHSGPSLRVDDNYHLITIGTNSNLLSYGIPSDSTIEVSNRKQRGSIPISLVSADAGYVYYGSVEAPLAFCLKYFEKYFPYTPKTLYWRLKP